VICGFSEMVRRSIRDSSVPVFGLCIMAFSRVHGVNGVDIKRKRGKKARIFLREIRRV